MKYILIFVFILTNNLITYRGVLLLVTHVNLQ